MSNKEVYEEIYNSYLNSVRHKTDYAEMGQPDPYDSMEEKLKQLLPETWRDFFRPVFILGVDTLSK